MTGIICHTLLGTIVKYKYLTMEEVNHYQEYLGTIEEQKAFQTAKEDDPRVPKRGPGPASVVTCNHTGWVEGFAMLPVMCQSFAARAES